MKMGDSVWAITALYLKRSNVITLVELVHCGKHCFDWFTCERHWFNWSNAGNTGLIGRLWRTLVQWLLCFLLVYVCVDVCSCVCLVCVCVWSPVFSKYKLSSSFPLPEQTPRLTDKWTVRFTRGAFLFISTLIYKPVSEFKFYFLCKELKLNPPNRPPVHLIPIKPDPEMHTHTNTHMHTQ